MRISKVKIECSCGNIFQSKYLPIIKCKICNNKLLSSQYFLQEANDERYKTLTDLGYTHNQILTAVGDIIFEDVNNMIKHVIKYYE